MVSFAFRMTMESVPDDDGRTRIGIFSLKFLSEPVDK